MGLKVGVVDYTDGTCKQNPQQCSGGSTNHIEIDEYDLFTNEAIPNLCSGVDNECDGDEYCGKDGSNADTCCCIL